MQLSKNVQPYEEKTYVLVTDRLHAKLYRASQWDFDLIEEKTNDRLKLNDSERYVSRTGGGLSRGGLAEGVDEKLDDREAHTFYKDLAHLLFEQKQKNEFVRLILVVPDADKNVFSNLLHEQVSSCLDLVLGKNLTRLPEDKLVAHIDEARRSL